MPLPAGGGEARKLDAQQLDLHIAFFTGYIPPYALPVYEEINRRLRRLTLLLSCSMEQNRNWTPEFGDLEVQIQRNFSYHRRWRHPSGFTDSIQQHLPWDTIFQVRRLKPDIIVSEELGLRSILCAFASRIYGKPLVLVCNLSEHTEQARGLSRVLVRKWLLRQCAAVTVNGASGERYLRSMKAPRIYRFPYVAVPDYFVADVRRRILPAKRLVLSSSLSERKGVMPFLQALANWCRKNTDSHVELEICGDGPLRVAVESFERPENLKLQLHGNCSFLRLSEIYRQSQILVLPTLADEWGLVVNEGLASGLPILGSVYSQAVDELIRDGLNGWRFQPDNPIEMEQAIERALITGPEELAEMSRRAKESICQRTPQWSADQFLVAVRDVACHKHETCLP